MAAAGEGQLHVSSKNLRAAEMGGRDRKKTDLLPVAAMMDVCDYTHATLHYKL